MKFIVIGLGNFGASLAEKLTKQGNEVIGIDNSLAKVSAFKEKISHTICLDATDEQTVADLPLKNTDIVMVCIGEDQGTNVIVTAILKNLEVKRLISRSINPLHEKILRALGVDEIIRPEEETAERWAKKLMLKGIVDSFELNQEFSVIEIVTPEYFIGKTIEEIGFRQNYNVIILTIIKNKSKVSFFGKGKTISTVQGIAQPDIVIESDDILVFYGHNQDLHKIGRIKGV